MAVVYHSLSLGKAFLAKLKEELKENFLGCQKIGVKLHFGEPGNTYAFKPEEIKPFTDLLKELKMGFFLYDTSVAYGGPRGETESHQKAAEEKGWGRLGEIKIDGGFVEVEGKNLTYLVSKPLAEADGVLVISHVKGHVCSGFGGAIKNLGMGALSKKTKAEIHEGGSPRLGEGCTGCGLCVSACPLNSLKIEKGKPVFKLCYGCSNCADVCQTKAIKPKIGYFDALLAEGAKSAQSEFKKVYYLSFLKNITKECDCEKDPRQVIAADRGFVFGKDGVALDQAAYDLIKDKQGEDVFLKFNKKTGLKQIEEAEKLGMGKRNYKLVNL